jgi:DNA-binding transcriptional ArsR family regulator
MSSDRDLDPNDASVLRAMLRLARHRRQASEDCLADRVGKSERAVRSSLRRLRGLGLVEIRFEAPPRLTLAGLAVAVALVARREGHGSVHSARTSRAA